MTKARRSSSRRTPSRASADAGVGATEPAAPKKSTASGAVAKAKVREKPAAPRTPKKARARAIEPSGQPPLARAVAEIVEPPGSNSDAEQTAKAEMLALLAESDRHPAHDAIEAPTRYDVLPSLYARLEALVYLAEAGPQEPTQNEALLVPPDISSFDPFDSADFADEAPFDPPDESDLDASATTARDNDAAFGGDELQPLALADEPSTPVGAIAPSLSPPSLAYLERARRAAQDQSAGQSQPSLLGVSVEKLERYKWRIAGAAAAPLLALGAWALYGLSEGNRGESPGLRSVSAEAAPTRDAVGEYRLAMQRLGGGRARDGVALLRDLAEAGFPMAQYQLAKVLERGEGAAQSLAQARLWTERAANGGNCRAMHDVGVFYARGEGIARDEAMAARWFGEAAKRGVADSQYNLGILYEQGRGVALDPKEALFWFLVAARNRDLNAIDRAVAVAAGLSLSEVAQVQARARSFQAQAADPIANGAFDAGAVQSCATGG